LEVKVLPHNKSQTIKEKESRAKFTDEPTNLKPDKSEEYPASLNNIPKNES
jgi:hypothetical protein